jgi:hypothetical protein
MARNRRILLKLFCKDRDQLIEKWETLKPDGTKTHFEFELTRKTPNAKRPKPNVQRSIKKTAAAVLVYNFQSS